MNFEFPPTPEPPHSLPQLSWAGAWLLVRKVWRRIENWVFWVVFVLILLYFLLQSALVQNWLVSKVTTYLSKELGTEVSVGHVDFEFFDKLVLENMLVRDLQGDTLAHIGRLSAGLEGNFFTVFSNRLNFDDVTLADAYIDMFRAGGQRGWNTDFLADYFDSPTSQPPKKSAPFPIKIKNLVLRNVLFNQRDAMRGQDLFFRLPNAKIRVNLMDFPSKIIDIRSVQLHGFQLAVVEYPSNRPAAEPSDSLAQKVVPIAQKSDTLVNQAPASERLRFKIANFLMSDGKFSLDRRHISLQKETPPEVMDFNHLQVSDIAMDFEDVAFDDDLYFTGSICHFAAREQSGFEVKHAEAESALVCDSLTSLKKLKILTPYSEVGDTFELRCINKTYHDFEHFNNNIEMSGSIATGSRLHLWDLTFFNKNLPQNAFFQKNKNTSAEISGQVRGFVNNLKGKDLTIRLPGGTSLRGNIDAENLANHFDELKLECKFDELTSSLPTLREIIPDFDPPSYFDKLGNFNYQGEYLLIFGYNHILNGNFSTEIGYGKLDMNLDLTNGKEKATYSGELNMHDFDLGMWTNNPDFGKTAFDVYINQSTGLTLPTISAKLTGTVDTLFFRNYNYQNIELNGNFDKKMFNGVVRMADPNIQFSFVGDVNLRDSLPVFDFSADIKRLDLSKLNLLNKDWVVSGRVPKFNLRGNNTADVEGNFLLRNFQIVQNKTENHRIDSLFFETFKRKSGSRYFVLKSEVAQGQLDGVYDLTRIPIVLSELMRRQFPVFFEQLGWHSSDTTMALTDQFNFNFRVINSKSLTRLILPNLDTLRDAQLIGFVGASEGRSFLQIEIPKLKIGDLSFQSISFGWNGERGSAGYDLNVYQTQIAGKQFAPFHFFGDANPRVIRYNLVADNFSGILKSFNLKGKLSVLDKKWQLNFDPSNLILFDEQWVMDENNFVQFGDGKFATQNFDFFNGDKRIFLDSLNNGEGLRMGMTGFDLSFLNNFFKTEQVNYRGLIYDFDLAVQQIFTLEGLSLYINTDILYINEVPYGFITGNVDLDNLDAPLTWKLLLADRDGRRLKTEGGWLFGGSAAQQIPELGWVQPKTFKTIVSAEKFPLKIAESFIPGVSGMQGLFNAWVRLEGPSEKIGMRGSVKLDGSFVIDYLKARFRVPNQEILLSDTEIFAFPGTYLLDADTLTEHRAKLTGGLRHQHFKNWKIDCRIVTEGNNFLVMDTRKNDNETFYGRGAGFFDARFSGTFDRTDINIRAITGQQTRLFIPLSGTEDQQEVNFIKFKNKNLPVGVPTADNRPKAKIAELKGLSFNMDLQINDAAEVQMIFDEAAGDIVKGKGNGNLTININREGEFKMYGEYVIQRGEYLFTLLNFVNKPFSVAQGGTISWFGDPYGAQINLSANYEMNTGVYNLLQDELELLGQGNADDPRIREAKKATRVQVLMQLKGDLFQPQISFDLMFPTLPNELKTLTDNKLRQIRQDPNELNRQVFGLVVVGSFLPSNSGQFISGGDMALVNTVTQFLSSQLSNYLSTLAQEWFGDVVSSLDFDVSYSEYRSALGTGGGASAQTGREVQVRLTSGIKNDRITVNVGSQFGLNGNQIGSNRANGFLGEDVTFEFQLTENRRWRLKVYQRTEPDVAGGRLRNRVGLGFAFRKEYDSFHEMMGGLGKFLAKK